MNKANFDSAKNVTVPNAWIEKALNLSPPRKRKISPFVIGTAASVVAVSTAVLFFNSKLSIQEFPMSRNQLILLHIRGLRQLHSRLPNRKKKPKLCLRYPSTLNPNLTFNRLRTIQVMNSSSLLIISLKAARCQHRSRRKP